MKMIRSRMGFKHLGLISKSIQVNIRQEIIDRDLFRTILQTLILVQEIEEDLDKIFNHVALQN